MSRGSKGSGGFKKFLIVIIILLVIGGVFGRGNNSDEPDITESTSTTIEQTTTQKETTTAPPSTTTTTTTKPTTEKQTTTTQPTTQKPTATAKPSAPKGLDAIPKYTGKNYVAINNNIPFFTSADYTTESYEFYSNLDSLGRCGYCMACIGKDLMPTEKRGEIGMVKPTGWHTIKYDCVEGKYLYNRSHLIGYQLSGENANVKNLITGTRYFNATIMLPFENMVADYVKETNNHVMYRVTPMFKGNNLLASGVLMEAWSVEDNGDGVCFNVFCFNIQPGVGIDYATGDSWLESGSSSNTTTTKAYTTTTQAHTNAASSPSNTSTYILNTNTKKFHYSYCSAVKKMSPKNKKEFSGTRSSIISDGYEPCKICNP